MKWKLTSVPTIQRQPVNAYVYLAINVVVDADINGDGKLSLLEYTGAMEEFLKALGGDAGTMRANDIAESFKRFDQNFDGKVTQQEWLAAVKRDSAKKTEL